MHMGAHSLICAELISYIVVIVMLMVMCWLVGWLYVWVVVGSHQVDFMAQSALLLWISALIASIFD
jgi:archaellum biogenesis protein FlaJ (TadC family)